MVGTYKGTGCVFVSPFEHRKATAARARAAAFWLAPRSAEPRKGNSALAGRTHVNLENQLT